MAPYTTVRLGTVARPGTPGAHVQKTSYCVWVCVHTGHCGEPTIHVDAIDYMHKGTMHFGGEGRIMV